MQHDTSRPVPTSLPGQLVYDPERLYHLRQHVATICQLPEGGRRFPGSQPVSFEETSLELLEREDFWVCEKSDGVRVLVLVVSRIQPTDGQEVQEVFLVRYEIDRKDDFYEVGGFFFPHWEDPYTGLKDTLFDGELVIDVDPKSGQQMLRLLAFDLIVIGDQNLMSKPLSSRYGRLKEWVIQPFLKCIRDFPDMVARQPFEIMIKPMELAYGLSKVFNEHLPRLQHGNDGLIFTSAEAPYTIGTDPKILKWKPPNENSIDFRLEVRFPPKAEGSEELDTTQKPAFLLMMNCGHRDPEEFFDELYITDSDWIAMRDAGVQVDDRVVEVVWDKDIQCWLPLRFRDDKREGNYRDVVYSIIQSIQDGVDQETLIAAEPKIRQKWKERAASRTAGRQTQPRPAPAPAGSTPTSRPSTALSYSSLKR